MCSYLVSHVIHLLHTVLKKIVVHDISYRQAEDISTRKIPAIRNSGGRTNRQKISKRSQDAKASVTIRWMSLSC